MNDLIEVENQIIEEQKTVDFDTREFTIEIMVNKYLVNIEEEQNELFVPDYQREFVWDLTRQSRLIESLVLGLPIPIIFVAENEDGRLEIVDGSQRIRTLSAYLSDELVLENLEKLSLLNGFKFSDLNTSRQRKIKNTPIRMVVLSDKTTESVKNDLFDRINRGSDLLLNMEKRKGIFKGEFNDFIYNECAKLPLLGKLAPLSKVVEKRQEHEELILRFFALIDNYPNYNTHYQGIGQYLDKYMEEKNIGFSQDEKEKKLQQLKNTLEFVNNNFEFGFLKGHNQQGVSRVFFEALSVGVCLALEEKPELIDCDSYNTRWVAENKFKNIISGKYKTHIPKKIKQRVDFVKKRILTNN
jgi:hypothetical protein